MQPEPYFQRLGRMAQRQAHLLVQMRRQRQRFRAHLHRRRPQRVGGLHGMPALHASLAALAFPDGNAKLPDHSAPHDLFLIL